MHKGRSMALGRLESVYMLWDRWADSFRSLANPNCPGSPFESMAVPASLSQSSCLSPQWRLTLRGRNTISSEI
jgi:hypothetical protein